MKTKEKVILIALIVLIIIAVLTSSVFIVLFVNKSDDDSSKNSTVNVIEDKYVEPLEEDEFNNIMIKIAERMNVFDLSTHHDTIKKQINEQLNGHESKEVVRETVVNIVNEYMDRERETIIKETLKEYYDEYSEMDYEKILRKTSNESLKELIIEYEIELFYQ